jgi:putative membrane protein
MKRKTILGLGVALVIGGAGSAFSAENDQAFIKKVIQGNLGEVQIGQLAQKNGSSDAVKSFGQTLVTDHTANNDKAKTVASAIGVTPPTDPSPEATKTIDKLSKLTGAAFDKEFAKDMVADHRKDIKEFSVMAKGKNTEVADFAKQTLPTLRKHLQLAETAEKQS